MCHIVEHNIIVFTLAPGRRLLLFKWSSRREVTYFLHVVAFETTCAILFFVAGVTDGSQSRRCARNTRSYEFQISRKK